MSLASAEYWIHFTARFGVYRLPAAITPQWLQIAGNSLSKMIFLWDV